MRRALLVLFIAVTALKVAVASHLDLFGDEAFYWSCSRQLDLAYADHPFMTALLVRGGTALLGNSPLGARLLFLVCGALLVPVVYALARSYSGERGALVAALVVLVLPLTALGTMLAVPDAPLLLFGACTLLALERATRGGSRAAWLAAGAFAGLGLCTHYRGVLVPLSAAAWLLLTRAGRAHLRTAGPWLAALPLLLGALPVLVFNRRLGWQPFLYQAGERHAAVRGAVALLRHPLEQAVVVTPVLYVALLASLVLAVRRARAGDDRAGLFACFALVPLGAFFVTSPITDASHDYVHWPQSGYLPLLLLLPAVLSGWARRGAIGRLMAGAAPGLAALAVVLVLLDALTGFAGRRFEGQFLGWSELGQAARAHLSAAAPGRGLVVADNYRAAVELQFQLGDSADVFVLEHPLNAAHGRALQFRLWERDERALPARAGETALVVVESSQTARSERGAWLAHVGSLFDGFRPDGQLSAAGGARAFQFFEGRVAAH